MNEYELINKAKNRIPHSIDNNIDFLLYQYRSFRGFWSILTSDSFWATNARFSNDTEEQRFGAKILDVLIKDAEKNAASSGEKDSTDKAKVDSRIDENYILCFCRQNDKLSQWRGYASNGGCSIGFELGFPGHYSIKDASDEKKEYPIIAQAGKVFYISARDEEMDDNAYLQKCKEELLGVDRNGASARDRLQEIIRRAPYIKHKGFEEEDEYRLVFSNESGLFDKCIQYKKQESTALRIPYVVARAGNPNLAKRKCVIRVCLSNPEQEDEVVEMLKKIVPITDAKSCHKDAHKGKDSVLPEWFCQGCTLRQWKPYGKKNCRYKGEELEYEIGLPGSKSCIYISEGLDQEEVHRKIYPAIKNYNSEIKVWCEGHLPIRSITVGPCENQATVKESIEYYCKHKYWLKDVDITVSRIPFRSTL